MDNTNINIRIFGWHIQLEVGKWFPTIGYNPWHKENNWSDGYFRVYNFFGFGQN